jgi:hypothetical protein
LSRGADWFARIREGTDNRGGEELCREREREKERERERVREIERDRERKREKIEVWIIKVGIMYGGIIRED